MPCGAPGGGYKGLLYSIEMFRHVSIKHHSATHRLFTCFDKEFFTFLQYFTHFKIIKISKNRIICQQYLPLFSGISGLFWAFFPIPYNIYVRARACAEYIIKLCATGVFSLIYFKNHCYFFSRYQISCFALFRSGDVFLSLQ